MSKAKALTLRALSRWPADNLRPEMQFKDIVRRGVKSRTVECPAQEDAELKQANALYSLLEDRYSKRYQVPSSMINPASNPTYYTDLVAELQAAPERSMFGAWLAKLKGMFRAA